MALTSRRTDFPSGLLAVWLLAKLLTHIGLAALSVVRPISERELLVAVWPPQAPLSTWFERVWFVPLERWDVAYYIRIAATGYQPNDGTLQFHPLYPAVARLLVLVGMNPLVALSIVSGAASLLLIIVVHKLARLHLGPVDAQFAILSFVLSPFAFALLVPYSEGVFLLFAVLCLYWARVRRWWWAGLAGALATLTRQQGLFLVLPMLWMMLEQVRAVKHGAGHGTVRGAGFDPGWLALLAVPLAYAGWLVYRALAFGDLWVGTSSFHDLVYSVLISPAAARVVPVQGFLWPWNALARAAEKLITAPDLDIAINLVGGAAFLVMLNATWRYLDASDRIYTAAIAIVSLSYHTGPIHPYMGLLRHLLLGFPVFLGFARVVRRRSSRALLVGLGMLGLSVVLVAYSLEAWVL